jgi:hypothetical protein
MLSGWERGCGNDRAQVGVGFVIIGASISTSGEASEARFLVVVSQVVSLITETIVKFIRFIKFAKFVNLIKFVKFTEPLFSFDVLAQAHFDCLKLFTSAKVMRSPFWFLRRLPRQVDAPEAGELPTIRKDGLSSPQVSPCCTSTNQESCQALYPNRWTKIRSVYISVTP